jgi:hypothetical protein
MMRRLYLALIFMALGTAGVLSLLASQAPDGLESTLEAYQVQEQPLVQAPLADYQIPGMGHPLLRRALAGLAGALVVAGLIMLVTFFLARGRNRRASSNG